MRVALVHDWLAGRRGRERALDVLCRLFPGRGHRGRLPGARARRGRHPRLHDRGHRCFYHEATPEALRRAMLAFEVRSAVRSAARSGEFQTATPRRRAQVFSEAAFLARFTEILEQAMGATARERPQQYALEPALAEAAMAAHTL